MSFTSLSFIIFFAIVFSIYWLARTKDQQNGVLLLASYLFMGWIQWKFAAPLILLTLSDYFIARKMVSIEEPIVRKRWLSLGVGLNLGSLFFYKYFNFFGESFQQLFALFNFEVSAYHLNFLLPLGISFYTLKKISYLFDLHRKTAKLERDFVTFALYAAFSHKQLLARSSHIANSYPS